MNLHDWAPVARHYDPILAGSIDATDTEPHDCGIIRALNSTYTPNKGVEGDPECTLFVGRLNYSTNEEQLRTLFAKYGQIKRCRLVRDFVTGFSRGYGFVEFVDKSDAKYAAKRLDHTTLDDKSIIVMFECERTLKGWIPRRLGGGFGGKKESGQLRFGGVERPFRKPIIVPVTTKSSLSGQHNTLTDRGTTSENGLIDNLKSVPSFDAKECNRHERSNNRREHSRSRHDGRDVDNKYKRSRSRERQRGRHFQHDDRVASSKEKDFKSDHRNGSRVDFANVTSSHDGRSRHDRNTDRSKDTREIHRKRSRDRNSSRKDRSRSKGQLERNNDRKRPYRELNHEHEKKKVVRSQLSLSPE